MNSENFTLHALLWNLVAESDGNIKSNQIKFTNSKKVHINIVNTNTDGTHTYMHKEYLCSTLMKLKSH